MSFRCRFHRKIPKPRCNRVLLMCWICNLLISFRLNWEFGGKNFYVRSWFKSSRMRIRFGPEFWSNLPHFYLYVESKYYRGWPESSGCFFSWLFPKLDSLSLGLWFKFEKYSRDKSATWFWSPSVTRFCYKVHCTYVWLWYKFIVQKFSVGFIYLIKKPQDLLKLREKRIYCIQIMKI